MRIRDVVTPHRQGALFGDVQLASYWDAERNRELAENYIFTTARDYRGTTANHVELGSAEMLERIVATFQMGNATNRMMAIANYGHGKSHFAVAAANFFGKPVDSEEFEAVCSHFAHAVNDDMRAQYLRAFREHQKPYLMVVLRGDEPDSLPTKLSRAVDYALKAHPETAHIQPPFWFTDAEAFLGGIDQSRVDAANAFLAEHGQDVSSLLGRVRHRDDSTFELCRELHRELYGTYPDFHGATQLNDLIAWLGTEVSGPGKPFAGTLLIFDEFTAFLSVYGAGGQRDRHAAPLQDMLNGVQNHKGTVSLIAFGTRDPQEQMGEFPDSAANNLTKELERIETRLRLRSVLEQVLDAFLREDDKAWDTYPQIADVRHAMDTATEQAYSLFKRRYAEQLKWDIRTTRARVGWGCFPLHPITTAAFSTISFSATSNPRSVLQFVVDALQRKADEDVIVDGKVNWALPIELVDYFGEMLTPRLWQQYQDAVQQLGGDITDDEKRVLKAMLLIVATSAQVGQIGYAQAVAAFSGLPHAAAKATLDSLAQRSIIHKQTTPERYAFWQSGNSGKIQEILQRKLNAMPAQLSSDQLNRTVRQLQDDQVLDPIQPTIGLGPSSDWAAEQIFVPVPALQSQEYIKALKAVAHFTPQATESPRGLAVWAVPTSEEDVAWCKAQLQAALDGVLGDESKPMMVLWSPETVPGMIEAIRRWNALTTFSPQEVQESGQEQYEQLSKLAYEDVQSGFAQFVKQYEVIVPRYAREQVPTGRASSTAAVLDVLYKRAFSDGPGEFFPNYVNSSQPFSRAVSEVALVLTSDSVSGNKAFDKRGPAKTLIDTKLVQEWKILGARRRLQEPGANSPVYAGWQLLSKAFAPGCKHVPLGPIVEQLLNPPYGYDIRTLPLLFSAWWGVHRHELTMAKHDLTVVTLDDLWTKGSQRKAAPKLPDFVELLSSLKLSRRDADVATKEADAIVRELRRSGTTLSVEQAHHYRTRLIEAAPLVEDNATKVDAYRSAATKLNAQLKGVEDYQKAVESVLNKLANAPSVPRVVDLLPEAAKLKKPNLIGADIVAPAEVQATIEQTLKALHERTCARNESLSDLRDYEVQRKRLTNLRTYIRDFPQLVTRTDHALQKLDGTKELLEQEKAQQERDSKARTALHAITVSDSTSLHDLQSSLEKLDKLPVYSEAVAPAVEAKRSQIKDSVANLERRVDGLRPRLEAARSRDDVRVVRDEILTIYNRVASTKLEDAVADARGLADDLRAFFEEYARIPTTVPKSPGEAAAYTKQLRELNCSGILSTHQHHLIEQRVQVIEDAVVRATQSAVQWFEQIEQGLAGGQDVFELDRQAAAPPAFLPEALNPKLAELRRRLEDAKNSDLMAKIENEFSQLTDRAQQEAVARRLWERVFGSLPNGHSSERVLVEDLT